VPNGEDSYRIGPFGVRPWPKEPKGAGDDTYKFNLGSLPLPDTLSLLPKVAQPQPTSFYPPWEGGGTFPVPFERAPKSSWKDPFDLFDWSWGEGFWGVTGSFGDFWEVYRKVKEISDAAQQQFRDWRTLKIGDFTFELGGGDFFNSKRHLDLKSTYSHKFGPFTVGATATTKWTLADSDVDITGGLSGSFPLLSGTLSATAARDKFGVSWRKQSANDGDRSLEFLLQQRYSAAPPSVGIKGQLGIVGGEATLEEFHRPRLRGTLGWKPLRGFVEVNPRTGEVIGGFSGEVFDI
jgi:hypothetical protein